MKKSSTKEFYFCTRPRLAQLLIDVGCGYRLCTNPWEPTRKAWQFDINVTLIETVRSYYDEIGKPLPPSTAFIFQTAEVCEA